MRRHLISFQPWAVALAASLAGCVVAPPAPRPPPVILSPVPPVAKPAPEPPPRAARQAGPPAEITSGCGIAHFRDTVLTQVNAARASARSCGARRMKAAPPLVWSRPLAEAADQHAVDMVVRRYFDHVSPDGKRVGQRVAAQGYKARLVAETIAGGDATVAGVLSGWLGSSDQCQTIMNPVYAEVGVACERQQGSQWGTYWTLVVATRR